MDYEMDYVPQEGSYYLIGPQRKKFKLNPDEEDDEVDEVEVEDITQRQLPSIIATDFFHPGRIIKKSNKQLRLMRRQRNLQRNRQRLYTNILISHNKAAENIVDFPF